MADRETLIQMCSRDTIFAEMYRLRRYTGALTGWAHRVNDLVEDTLERALSLLPIEQREVLLLAELGELSFVDLASALNAPHLQLRQ